MMTVVIVYVYETPSDSQPDCDDDGSVYGLFGGSLGSWEDGTQVVVLDRVTTVTTVGSFGRPPNY